MNATRWVDGILSFVRHVRVGGDIHILRRRRVTENSLFISRRVDARVVTCTCDSHVFIRLARRINISVLSRVDKILGSVLLSGSSAFIR